MNSPRGTDSEGHWYPCTRHAREQLAGRWPDTLIRPGNFDDIKVPRSATLIGYDSVTGGQFVHIPGTPMVAVVVEDTVTTFFSLDAAKAKIALHGYGPSDFVGRQEK